LAKLTASATGSESARLTSQSAKPIASSSAQVSLANFQLAKLSFLVSAVVDASSNNSVSIVDHVLEMKSGIMQIKNIHLSNMIRKVKDTYILLKF
jgi:hypothetical protein